MIFFVTFMIASHNNLSFVCHVSSLTLTETCKSLDTLSFLDKFDTSSIRLTVSGMSAPGTLEKPVKLIGHCKRCQATVRIDAILTTREHFDSLGYLRHGQRYFYATPTDPRAEGRAVDVYQTCICGKRIKFARIFARLTEKKCNAICMNAKHGSCDCSCGGKNHGKSHGA